jgi:hypothetical protein
MGRVVDAIMVLAVSNVFGGGSDQTLERIINKRYPAARLKTAGIASGVNQFGRCLIQYCSSRLGRTWIVVTRMSEEFRMCRLPQSASKYNVVPFENS